MQGAMFIKDRIGEWPIYPGHPLVIATEIMEVFPSFAAANEPTVQGWSAALGDQRITGAGCHVGAAMRVLKIGREGGRPEDMISYANRYWDEGKAGGHVKNVEAGRLQSQAVETRFLELCQSWFSEVGESRG
jgi:hypothetical protein